MKGRILALLAALLCLLCACARRDDAPQSGAEPEGYLPLTYAEEFSVAYYPGGAALLTVGEDRFVLLENGAQIPQGLETLPAIQLPLQNLYVASSSVMDLFCALDALDCVGMTSTKAADWAIPEVREAVENEAIAFVGKYSAPDFERVLESGCPLVIENTMIYHNPDVKERLESLGIPVLVERSSYENHPLGRLEWIKLYGLLVGKTEQARSYFDEQTAQLSSFLGAEDSGKTAAFFYIGANGVANVRTPGDYVSKMIELAGGHYVFSDLPVEEGSRSTMNMQMEAFYAGAVDADVLIYNATVDGGVDSIAQLLEKSELLARFKAVQNGNVWCTEQNMFQQTSGISGMIADLHAIFSGAADDADALTYLYRLH